MENSKYLYVKVALFLVVIGSLFLFFKSKNEQHYKPIRVGILHAQTGTMAISEKSVIDATLMAIDELNSKGGILNRKIEPIVVDSRSDWNYASKMAEKLINEDKVSAVFGCWTSACRKTIKPVFEKYNHLLFYPVQYEGLESSPNIVYLGASPNQQIIPAVKWSFDHLGKKFFLVGSDYIFPRTANELIKKQIQELGGEIVGEEYIALGDSEVSFIVDKIKRVKPDVILNTINGDSNIHFFKGLKEANIDSSKIPVMSFSIAEDELRTLDMKNMAGHYAAWNYFQSVNTPHNLEFVKVFKERFGPDRVVDDPMEAAYSAVHIWAQSVRDAKTDLVGEVLKMLNKQSFNAPGGIISIDPENQHTWKIVRIGKIRSDEPQFDIVWSSEKPIRPNPFPMYKTNSQWESFLNSYYSMYDNNWSKPTSKEEDHIGVAS